MSRTFCLSLSVSRAAELIMETSSSRSASERKSPGRITFARSVDRRSRDLHACLTIQRGTACSPLGICSIYLIQFTTGATGT